LIINYAEWLLFFIKPLFFLNENHLGQIVQKKLFSLASHNTDTPKFA